MTLGQLALAIALDENGQREAPPGSNRGPRVDVYLRAAGLDPDRGRYPWCSAFVTWALREAMLRMGGPHRWRGSASVSLLLARNQGLVQVLPAEGDVFIHLDPAGNHCGFVTGCRAGSVTTLEGNTDIHGSRTGGVVMHKFRPPGYASAFLRPA